MRFVPQSKLRDMIRRASRLLTAVLLLALVIFLPAPSASHAQTQPTNYWRYSAATRLSAVLPVDFNQDGVDELIVVDEDGKVDLINASGIRQWSYVAPAPIIHLIPLWQDGTVHLILATNSQIIHLDNGGQELWGQRIESLEPPLALLTGGNREEDDFAWTDFATAPVAIAPLAVGDPQQEDFLILLKSGQLQRVDGTGAQVWRKTDNIHFSEETDPLLAVGDVNGDGVSEIVVGLFNPDLRYSQILLLDADGLPLWEQALPVSGRITHLAVMPEAGRGVIAIGTNRGDLHLYDADRTRRWLRTLNKPISAMALAISPTGMVLVAGTQTGSVVAYDDDGRRLWTRHLAPDANRSVLNITLARMSPGASQPFLSVMVGSLTNENAPSDVILLGSNGRSLQTFEGVDTTHLSRITDLNHDQNSELLQARFATIELLGLGFGVSETALDWTYDLFALPGVFLVLDFDQDGKEDLLVGGQDGRLHRISQEGSPRWIIEPGGQITHLLPLSRAPYMPPAIIVAHMSQAGRTDGGVQGRLELRQANGEREWEQTFPAEITAVIINESSDQTAVEIIVGLANGEIVAYTSSGRRAWQDNIAEPVRHLSMVSGGNPPQTDVVVAGQQTLYKVNGRSAPRPIAYLSSDITQLYALNQPGNELANKLLVLLADGTVRGFNWRGIQLPSWPISLGSRPTISFPAAEESSDVFDNEASDGFLIATTANNLLHLQIRNNQPDATWQLPITQLTTGSVTSLYWDDLDGDALSDIALGTQSGWVHLYNRDRELLDQLNLFSGIVGLTALQQKGEKANLLVISENGLVQLFRAQENWPPLLTNPTTAVTEGRYSFEVAIQDVERDQVIVQLEVQNPLTGDWQVYEAQRLNNGNDRLFWLVDNVPATAAGVVYRFYYDDEFHQGYFRPPPGPPPLPASPLTAVPFLIWLVVGLGAVAVLLAGWRQSQLPSARARRFYRRLNQHREQALLLLERKYTAVAASPDFLLNLANDARNRNSRYIASLADGLFLLAGHPHVSLPILTNTLEAIARHEPGWQALDRWLLTHRVGRALLEAPSVTELALLHPRLEQLVASLEASGYWAPAVIELLPILTHLRDSQRVELDDDSLVYLYEAHNSLKQLQEDLSGYGLTIERTLVTAVGQRWDGLISSEIEELQGRAQLTIHLKTRRLAPLPTAKIVLEIANVGRAPAENLIANLDDNPAFTNHSPPQVIAFLPPGHTQEISFIIAPNVADRFRIALTITYNDRHQADKRIPFGDMVHVLPPVRDFNPIPNPYLPGTPLRRNSPLFFGRQELFEFISDNVRRVTQQNVLILVGQRRTGKTSILLNLAEYLPDNLVPVYIDCQSLGITAGIPAFLHELAWLIADALAVRDITVEVPELSAWEDEPTNRFQRQFIPQIQALLPPNHMLLLVFDEFEALENLVNDGLLPTTLFPYLRHLMQHSPALSFIFVGTRRLEEMTTDYWSVLFNIALYRKIGYLDTASALHLITDPVRPHLLYDDLALDKILRVTNGHPYFLQLVCYTLVKRANQQRNSYVTISDVNATLDEMMQLGEVHFAYLWQRSSHAEKGVLTAVAHLMERENSFHPADLVQFLESYGIQLDPHEVTEALASLVDRDILGEVTATAVTLYELKIGLVGLWIARNKSLSKLHATPTE